MPSAAMPKEHLMRLLALLPGVVIAAIVGLTAIAAEQLGAATSPPAPAASLFSGIDRQLVALLARTPPFAPVSWVLGDLFSTNDDLMSIAAGSPIASEAYIASLRNDEALLYKARADLPSPNASQEIRFVADDLATKLQYSRKQPSAFADTLGPDIIVSVITKRRGVAVDGYNVICNPRYLASSNSSLFPFRGQTSPARGKLPPGVFAVQVTRLNRTIARKAVVLGYDGRSSATIVIDVP